MEKNIRYGILYEYYKDLLSEKQQESIEQYHYEDLSLTEIAEIQNISKQAVSTNIKRAELLLDEYEDKLKLYRKNKDMVSFLEDLDHVVKENTDKKVYETINKMISDMISKLN